MTHLLFAPFTLRFHQDLSGHIPIYLSLACMSRAVVWAVRQAFVLEIQKITQI